MPSYVDSARAQGVLARTSSDQVTVNRQDLRDVLTLIALWVPPDFRPSIILDRLVAARDTATCEQRQET